MTDSLDNIVPSEFAQAISRANIDFTPAFVHGLLTAYCCEASHAHRWAMTLVTDIDPNDDLLATQLRYLNQAKNVISTQLADSEFSFQLLLHNTADTLHDEVLLTREWASGYWLGVQDIGLAERVAHDDLSNEFLTDLPQIIAMPVPNEDALDNTAVSDGYTDNYDDSDDVYDHDTGDDTRNDIIAIQEYCRAGVIGVFLASWKD